MPPTEPVAPQPPAPPTLPQNEGKSKRLLMLVGGIAAILLSLALGLSVLGRKSNTPTSSRTNPSPSGGVIAGWPTYTNAVDFYTIQLPPGWTELPHAPSLPHLTQFTSPEGVLLQISAEKTTAGSLDTYLGTYDVAHQADWNNGPSEKANSTKQVKVNTYDGYERAEFWSEQSLQTIVTYAKVQDEVYIFALIPTAGKNSLPNQAVVNDYHTALGTFTLTSTAQLGKDWKTYTSTAVPGLSYPPFTISYPQTWTASASANTNNLSLVIYRNNYEIDINQAPVGTSVCLFSDSPAFNGLSGDLRNKQYTEMTTNIGVVLRRYFNANNGATSTMYFCEHQAQGLYFVTPLTIGGLVYTVPAQYDPDVISEMDTIVKTLAPAPSSSPSASPTSSPQ